MLTDRQLQGYRPNFVHTEGGQLENVTYRCWSKLQDLCKETATCGMECGLPAVNLPLHDASQPEETSVLLSCSPSEVVMDVSEMLDTEAATSCQMSQATTENDDEQNKQHKAPGEACIEVLEQSFSDLGLDSSVQKPNTCSTPVPNDFPFHNRSFPVCWNALLDYLKSSDLSFNCFVSDNRQKDIFLCKY